MKRSICILFILTGHITFIFSQTDYFTVPKSPILSSPEDYKSYEPDMVKAAKWLEETPLENNLEKRKEVNAFVLQWISGSPNVSISITLKLMSYFKKNPDLIMVYMASFSRDVIENASTFTNRSAAKAGLLSVLACYQKSKAKKEAAIEKLKKDQDHLDKYVDEILAE
jgi:hypothetical protein